MNTSHLKTTNIVIGHSVGSAEDAYICI